MNHLSRSIAPMLAILFCLADPAVASASPALRAEPAPASGPAQSSPAIARVRAANRAAAEEPASDRFVNSAQIYPWSEGALYRLYAAPGRVSDIMLQPGESLVSVAAGDTARWVIGDTASGSGPTRRTHVLVKPTRAGLSTNLVIATDRRLYMVELQSISGAAMPAIAWSYPRSGLVALKGSKRPEPPVSSGVELEALNFDYAIDGDRPPWRPLRAFDDGSQVFIEFPASFGSGEAPPLFLVGSGGKAELVNYRLRGRYYVVDRLFSLAELRLGGKKQSIVRIRRLGPSGEGRRR